MSARLIKESIHKAKKQHTCELCFSPIIVGQMYKSKFCVMDGEGYSFRTHLACDDIASHYSALGNYDDDYGYDRENFLDDVLQNFEEVTGQPRGDMKLRDAVDLFVSKWEIKRF